MRDPLSQGDPPWGEKQGLLILHLEISHSKGISRTSREDTKKFLGVKINPFPPECNDLHYLCVHQTCWDVESWWGEEWIWSQKNLCPCPGTCDQEHLLILFQLSCLWKENWTKVSINVCIWGFCREKAKKVFTIDGLIFLKP